MYVNTFEFISAVKDKLIEKLQKKWSNICKIIIKQNNF